MKKQLSIKKSPTGLRKNRPRNKRVSKKKEEEDMPTYKWVDKNTNNVIEVQRRLKEIDTPPDKDEIVNSGVEMDIHDFAHADWERVISNTEFIGIKQKGSW